MSASTSAQGSSIPQLAKGVRLRHDPARDQTVLLAPERLLVPDPVSLEVLQAIDGTTSVATMANRFAGQYDADPGDIQTDILEMVDDLCAKGFLRILPAPLPSDRTGSP